MFCNLKLFCSPVIICSEKLWSMLSIMILFRVKFSELMFFMTSNPFPSKPATEELKLIPLTPILLPILFEVTPTSELLSI